MSTRRASVTFSEAAPAPRQAPPQVSLDTPGVSLSDSQLRSLSPTSQRAIDDLGLAPNDLVSLPLESFAAPGLPEPIQLLRAQNREAERLLALANVVQHRAALLSGRHNLMSGSLSKIPLSMIAQSHTTSPTRVGAKSARNAHNNSNGNAGSHANSLSLTIPLPNQVHYGASTSAATGAVPGLHNRGRSGSVTAFGPDSPAPYSSNSSGGAAGGYGPAPRPATAAAGFGGGNHNNAASGPSQSSSSSTSGTATSTLVYSARLTDPHRALLEQTQRVLDRERASVMRRQQHAIAQLHRASAVAAEAEESERRALEKRTQSWMQRKVELVLDAQEAEQDRNEKRTRVQNMDRARGKALRANMDAGDTAVAERLARYDYQHRIYVMLKLYWQYNVVACILHLCIDLFVLINTSSSLSAFHLFCVFGFLFRRRDAARAEWQAQRREETDRRLAEARARQAEAELAHERHAEELMHHTQARLDAGQARAQEHAARHREKYQVRFALQIHNTTCAPISP